MKMSDAENRPAPFFPSTTSVSLMDLYENQKYFQNMVVKKFGYNTRDNIESLPVDSVDVSSYHMQALMEEVGELVKSDKRWKNYRNNFYDKENKLEEVADCMICLLNICLFSGITCADLEEAIKSKFDGNFERIAKQN